MYVGIYTYVCTYVCTYVRMYVSMYVRTKREPVTEYGVEAVAGLKPTEANILRRSGFKFKHGSVLPSADSILIMSG